jgi:hypothetical protein
VQSQESSRRTPDLDKMRANLLGVIAATFIPACLHVYMCRPNQRVLTPMRHQCRSSHRHRDHFVHATEVGIGCLGIEPVPAGGSKGIARETSPIRNGDGSGMWLRLPTHQDGANRLRRLGQIQHLKHVRQLRHQQVDSDRRLATDAVIGSG